MHGFAKETCEVGFEVKKYNIWVFSSRGVSLKSITGLLRLNFKSDLVATAAQERHGKVWRLLWRTYTW